MTPCLFLINSDHIFFFHSQFFGSVIINNFLTFKEKPEWIHGNFLSLTIWFFEFLEMYHHFHFEVTLTAILSGDFEFTIFSFFLIPQVLGWRFCFLVGHGDSDFSWGLRKAAASGRQNLTPEFINLFSPPIAQHQGWKDFLYALKPVSWVSTLLFLCQSVSMWVILFFQCK